MTYDAAEQSAVTALASRRSPVLPSAGWDATSASIRNLK